jgi:hypothetical protein
MKAKELRIGNLLYNDNVVVTIDARTIFDIWDDAGLKKYKPIPLTEEWLLKLGFEKIYESNYRLKFDHKIHMECGYDFSKVEDKSEEGFRYFGKYIKIQHVHQLQNLFYSLCGEELL